MQRLLYVCPVPPAPTGSGIAMRAFHNLDALRRRFEVRLMVVRPHLRLPWKATSATERSRPDIDVPFSSTRDWPWILRLYASRLWPGATDVIASPSDWIGCQRFSVREAVTRIDVRSFDILHLFRLYMTPVLEFLRAVGYQGPCQLDLDEMESSTRRSIARVCRQYGYQRLARRFDRDARRYEAIEERYLPHFDRVFVASSPDRQRLLEQVSRLHVEVVPNVISLPPKSAPDAARPRPFVLLFMGALAYFPNLAAVIRLSERIAPLLRQQARRPWKLRIVGDGLPANVGRRLKRLREAECSGYVDDIGPCYRSSDIAVVPLEAGGGSRIKILEAFAWGVPVVSTSVGVEGIEAVPGRHFILADSDAEIASVCARLMEDANLREDLARNAFSLVESRYNAAALADTWH